MSTSDGVDEVRELVQSALRAANDARETDGFDLADAPISITLTVPETKALTAAEAMLALDNRARLVAGTVIALSRDQHVESLEELLELGREHGLEMFAATRGSATLLLLWECRNLIEPMANVLGVVTGLAWVIDRGRDVIKAFSKRDDAPARDYPGSIEIEFSDDAQKAVVRTCGEFPPDVTVTCIVEKRLPGRVDIVTVQLRPAASNADPTPPPVEDDTFSPALKRDLRVPPPLKFKNR